MTRLIQRLWTKAWELSRPRNSGHCVICEQPSVFVIYDEWLRDHYRCKRCYSIPRNRALVNALNRFVPAWKNLAMHESSPGGPLSDYLKRSCPGYSSSHFFKDVPRGQSRGGIRSEDLAQLTYPAGSFDLFITSDVFEHVDDPVHAFREISRVLKPGGHHVFTMPWYPANDSSTQRARRHSDGTHEFLMEPVYHGNPIDSSGSLVTYDWGLDFTTRVLDACGMATTVYVERDRTKGLDGELLEVFVSQRTSQAASVTSPG